MKNDIATTIITTTLTADVGVATAAENFDSTAGYQIVDFNPIFHLS